MLQNWPGQVVAARATLPLLQTGKLLIQEAVLVLPGTREARD